MLKLLSQSNLIYQRKKKDGKEGIFINNIESKDSFENLSTKLFPNEENNKINALIANLEVSYCYFLLENRS